MQSRAPFGDAWLVGLKLCTPVIASVSQEPVCTFQAWRQSPHSIIEFQGSVIGSRIQLCLSSLILHGEERHSAFLSFYRHVECHTQSTNHDEMAPSVSLQN